MAKSSQNDLLDFLNQYDSNGTGAFNRDRWLHLCSSSAISLPQDLAASLFDRLDVDADGIVTITDLLEELAQWQKLMSAQNNDPDFCSPTDMTTFSDFSPSKGFSEKSSFFEMRKRPENGVHDNKGRRNFPRLSSVYESNPGEYDSDFQKSLHYARDLEQCIRESYPELATPFQKLLTSFNDEIIKNKTEHESLEESYKREKEARNADLKRLEEELDMQMQLVEEKLQSDIRKKVEAEYQKKVAQKEIEIRRMQESVSDLKDRLKENKRQRSTVNYGVNDTQKPKTPQMQDDVFGSKAENYLDPDALVSQSIELRKTLKEAQIQLRESEAELYQLRTALDTQTSELHLEKLRCSNFVEEKNMLYDQVQKMRSMLTDVYGTKDDICRRKLPNDQMIALIDEWNRDSGQGSAINDFSNSDTNCSYDRNVEPYAGSVSSRWSPVGGYHAPDRIFRVIMVGDSAVGKTSFMHRFCTGDFYQNTRATIGVDFKTRNLPIDGSVYSIELWDTAGQEKFHSMVSQYFRKSDGAILMYDVSSPASFIGVRHWMSILEENSGDHPIPKVIIGNKIDLRNLAEGRMNGVVRTVTEANTIPENPEDNATPKAAVEEKNLGKVESKVKNFVRTEMGADLAKGYNAEFCEISVLGNTNIDEAIIRLARKMKLHEDMNFSTINLRKHSKRSKCCA